MELLFIRMCFAYIAHEINIGLPLQSLFLFKQAHAMGIDRSHISRIIPNNSSFIWKRSFSKVSFSLRKKKPEWLWAWEKKMTIK